MRLRPACRAEVGLLFYVQEVATHTEDWTSAGTCSRGGLPISCAGGRDTHGRLDFGRCVEQGWPYYFLCRRPRHTRETGLRPVRGAEVTLLFLVPSSIKKRQTHADAERRRGGTSLTSSNPNTEGGEQNQKFQGSYL